MIDIRQGHVLDRLREMPDESVHCVVTSPPYWGLRDYGTARWEGGDLLCEHRSDTMRVGRNEDRTKLAGSPATNMAQLIRYANVACGKCGAVRVDHQLGLEPTYQEHVAKMAAVFDEVRRVLRPDGTLWLNYGDSYATSPNGRKAADVKAIGNDDRTFRDKPFSTIQGALKAKDLCGIPWRVAFALQEAGWYLRQDIIWAKPNPMPESIKDRCTKGHEYLFLMSKSERYHFDSEAIMEEMAPASVARLSQPNLANQRGSDRVPGKTNGTMKAVGRGLRNRRSVWTVATQPFKEAHFATFPPKLIEPCILAGCPEGGVVLDPFFGAGTTGLVARQHGRRCIGIELNPEYIEIAKRRLGLTSVSGLTAVESLLS